jgi:hypothetical protein
MQQSGDAKINRDRKSECQNQNSFFREKPKFYL